MTAMERGTFTETGFLLLLLSCKMFHFPAVGSFTIFLININLNHMPFQLSGIFLENILYYL